jgi:hypothetical protein
MQQSFPAVKYSVTRLGSGVTSSGVSFPGGLDQTTPSLQLQPGACRDAINFECSQSGGYARIEGYERFDGRLSPSSASYQIIQVSAFVNVPVVGNTITQAVSGATGKVVAVVSASGVSYVAITKITGVFDFTDTISVGATLIGTVILQTALITSKTGAQYLALAADVYRADIGAVPGSGAILGVVAMNFSGTDNVYAFRGNAGNTAVAIYKQSASGWTLVPFYKTVSFTTGGVATPADGETLTQGGVTATVKRVVTQSGAWTGAAAGQFVITTPSGGNFSGAGATLSGGATVTLTGIQTAITLIPGGKFVFAKGNFSGQSTTRRIYGVDGVNKAFEFDGGTLVPIATGLSPDNPKFICIHKNFLFLSKDSSIIYSGAGVPYKFGSVAGGGEIATGDNVTGLITLPGSQTTATLCVYMRSNTSFLYGTDPTTFNFVTFNTGIGALSYTCQNLADTFALDDLGVVTLKTTLNYGNFLPSSLTKDLYPFIKNERAKVTCSSLMRSKSQYRLFFSDGYGLYLTSVNQQYLGAMPVLFPNPVNCVDEDDSSDFGMVSYFGSNDGLGYVYQLDMGTSFDGGVIDAHISLAWDALKSPRILKRFRAASIEMQGNAYAQISFGYQLGYGSLNIGQPANVNYSSGFSGVPLWDSFVWDNFIWDGQTLMPTDVDMTGTAENVQVILSSTTNYIAAFNVNSVIYQYTSRRGMRV